MKKLFALLLAVLMCLSLAACSGGGETPAEPAPAEEPAAETSGETFEELLAAGIANGNKLTIYSTHSVTVSALEAFHNKYCPDVECEGTQVGDTEQVTQVAQEVKEGVLGADIIFIQDGARVLTDLVDEGYVYNWYNDEIKNLVGDDAFHNETVLHRCFKKYPLLIRPGSPCRQTSVYRYPVFHHPAPVHR